MPSFPALVAFREQEQRIEETRALTLMRCCHCRHPGSRRNCPKDIILDCVGNSAKKRMVSNFLRVAPNMRPNLEDIGGRRWRWEAGTPPVRGSSRSSSSDGGNERNSHVEAGPPEACAYSCTSSRMLRERPNDKWMYPARRERDGCKATRRKPRECTKVLDEADDEVNAADARYRRRLPSSSSAATLASATTFSTMCGGNSS